MNIKLFLIILVCVGCLAYFGYLNNGFVFDDKILVEANPLIKSARLLPDVFRTGIYEYWSGPQPYDRMYRPLQMLSYYLDYNFWGLHPAGFRFTNLILHLLNSILVFYLIWIIFKHLWLAQASSILFLVHPVQISTVAYISGRGDLLSAFFILAGCILFLKFLESSDYRLYFLSILAAGFALLSRENAILIIYFLVLIGSVFARKKLKLKDLNGFFILVLVYLAVRVIALGPSGIGIHPAYSKGLMGLVNFVNIIIRYILLLFWPRQLRMFHTTDFIDKLTLPILGLIIFGFILLAMIWILRRKKKLPIHPCFKFGVFWFLLGLTPAGFFFDAYPALGKALMAESWLYLPSIGFFTVLTYCCLLAKKGRLIIAAAGLILAGLVVANRVYWRNDVVFYERVTRFLPDDNIIQKNLAAAYIQEGKFTLAYEIIKKLERYYPDSPVTYSAWGQYYLGKDQPNEALDYYQRLLGKSFFTNYSMSLCYSKLGDLDKAIEFAQASFDLNQVYLPNIIQLVDLYQQSGQPEEANKYFNLAKELDPQNKEL